MMKVSGFYITILFIAMLMDPIHTLCQGNNEMDMIMFYDCDHGSLINNRPDNGWWHLNPEYPKDPTTENHHRITTSLLGTYESQDPAVIKQHAYWFQALGCNVFASDLTNIASVRAPGSSSGMESYYSGVLKAFENHLKELREIEEFDAPEVYPVLRLFGTTYGTFEYMLDDVYALYEKYPEKWYTLDDESEDSSKPFIVVFTDWTLLSNWASNGVIPDAKDDRFNIRWSNGFLLNTAGITETGTNGTRKIPGDVPFWLFVENEQTTNGRYQAVYKESPDKQSVEQMITWASVWLNGNEWDGLRDTIDGKLPIERYSEPVFDLNPQTLLVNRFNYPLAWMGMPGEGVSRNKSTHIEPNVDWGFLEFNDVAKVLYDIRGTEKAAPPAPLADSYNFKTNKLKIKLDGFPLEYRISNNQDLSGSTWAFLNVGKGGIECGENINITQPIFIQTRNSFGVSPVNSLNLITSQTWASIDDASDKIIYDSNWETGNSADYRNNSFHYSETAGATATFRFTGEAIRLIGATGQDNGKAEIFIDGELHKKVDLYSETPSYEVIVFSDSSFSKGNHTIEVRTSGEKNESSNGTRVFIDAFEVKNSWFSFDNMSDDIVYDSNWETDNSIDYRNNTCHYSGTTGATARFSFVGEAVRLIGTTSKENGKAEIYIDGELHDTIDFYSLTTSREVLLFSIESLTNGPHTIDIVVTGEKNENSNGTSVFIDAFEIIKNPFNITFKVSNTDNEIIENAKISLNSETLYTDKDGFAEYVNIWESYNVEYSVEKEGYRTISNLLDVITSDTIDISLGHTCNITFEVSDATGPLNGAAVRMGDILGFTNAEGSVDFKNIGIGSEMDYSVSKFLYISTSGSLVANDNIQVPIMLDSSDNLWYVIDDTSQDIIYQPSWEKGSWEGYYKKTCHYTFDKGASVTLTFNGTGIKLIGATNVDKGTVEVYIDSAYVTTIDFYSDAAALKVVMFEMDSLSNGEHTFQLVTTGEKNENSNGTSVFVDAFEIKSGITKTPGLSSMKKNIIVAPNPCSEYVTFSSVNMNDKNLKSIAIYDIYGKQVVQTSNIENSRNHTIPLSNLELHNGLYFYKVRFEKSSNIESGKFLFTK